MLLTPDKNRCEKNQAIVVSKDKGNSREHRAINPRSSFDLRHYKLDGDVVSQTRCCDFLLVNDTKGKAYLIELKGSKIEDAIDQLEAGEQICKPELRGYTFFYRVVCSKAKTHQIQGSQVRKFKDKKGSRLIIKENILTETLD